MSCFPFLFGPIAHHDVSQTPRRRLIDTIELSVLPALASCLPGGYHSHSGGGGGGSWVAGVNTGWSSGANQEDDGHLQFIFLGNDSLPLANKVRIGTCGMSGRDGPSNVACGAAYRYQSSMDAGFYSGTNSGFQQISIQTSGLYRVIAAGARSGHTRMSLSDACFGCSDLAQPVGPELTSMRRVFSSGVGWLDRRGGHGSIKQMNNQDWVWGGSGAIAAGIFNFTRGQTIQVAVGQNGDVKRPGEHSYNNIGGAGGGGTFVWITGEDDPLLAAGGGGGISYQSASTSYRSVSNPSLAYRTYQRGCWWHAIFLFFLLVAPA